MFRSNVDLVLVNVTVLDHSNHTVTGLAAADFSLLEDKQSQSIKYFSSEDQPLSLAIVLDASASMAPRIEQVRKAVLDLIRSSNPLDDISLVTVGDKPRIDFHFDDSIEALPARVESVQPTGQTALWDAMYISLEEMKRARPPRRAMVIISDGGDNHSLYTESELKSLLEEADVEVYAIGLFDRFPRRNEERSGPRDLDELTSTTGGRLISVHDAAELARAVTQINNELRNQYILGYYPSNRTDHGRWRKLKVTLNRTANREKLHLLSKKQYYAALQ
jgi:Ca-activated chloride channel family protein